jgi:hypothetical protein
MTNKIFDDGLHAKWKKFHYDNPRVYDLFKKFTFQAIQAGHKSFSSDAICHRIRWETSVVTLEEGVNLDTGEKLKINNNHVAYYGRKFMRDYPKYDGFFRTRDTKSA